MSEASTWRAVGRCGAALLLLAAAAVPLSAADALPGDWYEAKSDHFVIVGNAGEKRLRATAIHFEQVRAHFLDVAPLLARSAARPLPIFVARDRRTMKLFMPSLFEDRGRAPVAGRFVDLSMMQFVQLQADASEIWREQVVAHEYFHYLVNRMATRLPVWLDEGLAEFWGATQFTADSRVVGRLIEERLAWVRNRPLLPLDRLFAVDRSSAEYRGVDLAPRFYAQSWALVHFLTLGKQGAREAELRNYLRLIAEKVDPVAAGKQAFGDLRALERELVAYLQLRLFPLGEMKAVAAPDPARITVRRLRPAEAASAVAMPLLHTEPPARARPLVDAARAAEPELVSARLAQATLAIRERRFEAASAEFEAIRLSGTTDPLALYGAAVTRLFRGADARGLDESERDLRSALAIDPDFTAAKARLADTLVRKGGDVREALELLRSARRVRPSDAVLALREVEILSRAGRDAESSDTLMRLIDGALGSGSASYMNNLCWYGALSGLAAAVMPLCDRSLELVPEAASALDSRGVARALAGDVSGAIADLKAAVAAAGETWSEAQIARRRAWIEALGAGGSPFDENMLLELRFAPEESGGWGY